ncbi:hypothetical protein G4228_013789 [Cervus hanglu yarkandensis]|nr:hypothetical protein G4228_013789 [Cervus hanglu yarkandensis]
MYKKDFQDRTEKFLISEATAHSLANQLQKYKCDPWKDIVESVLGEKLPVELRRPAEKLAEKPTLDERLSMELQKVEKKEVHEESKDECILMPSILQGSSDKHQPYSDDKFAFDEQEVGLGSN